MLRAQPDVILMGNRSMQVAHPIRGWYMLDAVEHQPGVCLRCARSDVIVRPGPRMDEAARIIARCLSRAKSASHARMRR